MWGWPLLEGQTDVEAKRFFGGSPGVARFHHTAPSAGHHHETALHHSAGKGAGVLEDGGTGAGARGAEDRHFAAVGVGCKDPKRLLHVLEGVVDNLPVEAGALRSVANLHNLLQGPGNQLAVGMVRKPFKKGIKFAG